jgi:hypothetical protein
MYTATSTASATVSFWSDSYHGRQIAAYRHGSDWLVYLDNVMQANRAFASVEDAIRWLRRKVDDVAFDSRVAMICGRHARRQRKALSAFP